MSSILEALRKLEAEKAAKQAEEGGERAFEPKNAGMELLADAPEHPSGSAIQVRPATLVAGALGLVAVLALISGVVAMLVVRSYTQSTPPSTPGPAASIAPAPPLVATPAPAAIAPEPATLAAKPEPPAMPAETTKEEPQPAPTAEKPEARPEVAAAPAPKPEAPAEETPAEPEPKPRRALPEETEPKLAAKADDSSNGNAPMALSVPGQQPARDRGSRFSAPQPSTPSMAAPMAAPNSEPQPAAAPDVTVNLDALPVLRGGELARFGLETMHINVLREAGPNRPYAVAIINLNNVYVGDTIPGTSVKLVGIRRNGIGIQIPSTGETFFVEQ